MQLTCNWRMVRRVLAALVIAPFWQPLARAGEGPFFVTYSHQREEPGNLEITTKNVTGKPGDGNRFLASALELEYGLKGWWTTEVYLDGQEHFIAVAVLTDRETRPHFPTDSESRAR